LNLNVSMVKSEMRDKGGIDTATLAKNWGIGIKAAKRTRLVTTKRGIRRMVHPSLTKRYKTNDRQLRYRRLPVTMYTDTMYSTILSRQMNKAPQIFTTDFVFVRAFPMKKEKDAHEALKKGVVRQMMRSGCPTRFWDDCIIREAYVRSHTLLDIYGLEGQVPESKIKGETVDISTIT
jgi:hypothetical protein